MLIRRKNQQSEVVKTPMDWYSARVFTSYARDALELLADYRNLTPPAFHLRGLLYSHDLEVDVMPGLGEGCEVDADKARPTIWVGERDPLSPLGLWHPRTRAFTSRLAWAFASWRLYPEHNSEDAHNYAAALLCPYAQFPDRLPTEALSKGDTHHTEALAAHFLVDTWVVQRALLGYGIVDRILTNQEVQWTDDHCGGTPTANGASEYAYPSTIARANSNGR